MSLQELWNNTLVARDEGELIFLKVHSEQKPTGLTARNNFVASCEPLQGEPGLWEVGIWRKQLNMWAGSADHAAGMIVNGLNAARAKQHAVSSAETLEKR